MNSYKIYRVNGLGRKTEVAFVLADSVDWNGGFNYAFFKTEKNWLGRITGRTLLHHYTGSGPTLVAQDVFEDGDNYEKST